MAGRSRRRDTGRDPGGFAAIPWSVLDSPAYMALSHPAKALLMEIARQYRGSDNGRLLVTNNYMRSRGWKSPAVIHRAKRELLEAGMIFQTVTGMRPNKASWYAVTWRSLDRLDGYDPGVLSAFERGAYRRMPNTSGVLAEALIGTSPVLGKVPSSTSGVPIRALLTRPPSTSPVLPLEVAISEHTREILRTWAREHRVTQAEGESESVFLNRVAGARLKAKAAA